MAQTALTETAWEFEPHGAFGTDFLGEDWPLGYISRETPRTPIFALCPILELPTDELLASAHMMAAAPKMLAALKRVESLDPMWMDGGQWDEVLTAVRTAIAKATTPA